MIEQIEYGLIMFNQEMEGFTNAWSCLGFATLSGRWLASARP